MKIIYRKLFKKIRDVRLNREGKKIGELVWYGNKIYYLTERNDSHYMVKHHAFGIDKGILKHILDNEIEYSKPMQDKNFILFMIFHYRGARERRYYIIDPMKIEELNINEQYVKDTDSNTIESYGSQLFVPLDKMGIMGYDPDDEVFRK